MEYLMTYGWAILVILIAVITAWQFGLLKIGSATGSGYSGFGEVVPLDFALKSNGTFIIILENAAGDSINVTQVTANVGGTTNSTPLVNVEIKPGGSTRFAITGFPEGEPSDQYAVNPVIINFTDGRDSANPDHSSAGRIWGNYE